MILELYILDRNPNSQKAIDNLELLSQSPKLKDSCQIQIIDLSQQPELREKEKILATPVLIKKSPLPECRIIGTLSDQHKVLTSLQEMATKVYDQ